MTVQELIDDLNKVEDKSLEVCIHAGIIFNHIRKTSVMMINDKYNKKIDDKTILFLHRGGEFEG